MTIKQDFYLYILDLHLLSLLKRLRYQNKYIDVLNIIWFQQFASMSRVHIYFLKILCSPTRVDIKICHFCSGNVIVNYGCHEKWTSLCLSTIVKLLTIIVSLLPDLYLGEEKPNRYNKWTDWIHVLGKVSVNPI